MNTTPELTELAAVVAWKIADLSESDHPNTDVAEAAYNLIALIKRVANHCGERRYTAEEVGDLQASEAELVTRGLRKELDLVTKGRDALRKENERLTLLHDNENERAAYLVDELGRLTESHRQLRRQYDELAAQFGQLTQAKWENDKDAKQIESDLRREVDRVRDQRNVANQKLDDIISNVTNGGVSALHLIASIKDILDRDGRPTP